VRRIVLVFLSLAVSLFAADPADAVREASTGWRQAAIKKDAAGLRRFLADDMVYSHADGRSQSKAEYIAAVIDSGRYESFTESDTTVRVYGRAAVLRGFVDVKLANQPAYRVFTLEVYVENNGQWQMTAHQSVRINRPNAKQ
jgi:ketosteroid isomerase-like protein